MGVPAWVSICPSAAAAYDYRCVDGYVCMGGGIDRIDVLNITDEDYDG